MLDELKSIVFDVSLENTNQLGCKFCLDFKFDMILLMQRIEVYELLLDINIQLLWWEYDTCIEIRIDILISFIDIPYLTHVI